MARAPRRKADSADQVEEVQKPDFEKAKKLLLHDVKPALSRAAEFNQEASTAYKAIKKDARVHPGAAKVAFKLHDMEYEKRQEWLRCFQGMLTALNIGLDPDLFDGPAANNVVPLKAPENTELPTIQ